jgi:alpha-mannosidase
MGKAIDWFDRASAEAHDLAVVKGELYFELHRGTYTTQSRAKRLNRRAQEALREAEMWSIAAGAYPREELERLWKTLLLNQFHDILPGSSIDWVYEDAERDLDEVVKKAEAIARHAGAPPPPPTREGPLENEFLRVQVDHHGVVTSIWDKEAAREVLGGPGNILELHDDNPRRWDAWDLDLEHRDAFTVVDRSFGESAVHQRIALDGRVLRFETEVDWQERHKILKVAFPVAVSAREAAYEVQFGHVRRPTHWEDARARAMFEVCAQRWADLGDGDYGVALLNDSKHGYDVHDGVMRLSLLRAPAHPDPNADQGRHRFTYALMPHPGDFREAGVIEAAEQLNSVLGIPPDLVTVETPQVRVEAVKRAEDSDAVIVRLYEAWGRSCRARLSTTLPARRAILCDLLEREREETSLELHFRPFQVVTLKLEA